MNENFDSIIFDMDGTLWDAVNTYAKSWNIYFYKNGINRKITKKVLDNLMGLEESLYLEQVIPEFPSGKRKEIYSDVINLQYGLIEKEGGHLYDGVFDGIKKLSEYYQLFIVSNCPEYTIRCFIKWSKLENYFKDSISHGENLKPKFENIELLKKKHKLSLPIYIGDTDSDRIQSEKANIPFVFMDYGFGKSDNYFLKFSSFTNFTNHMLQYNASKISL